MKFGPIPVADVTDTVLAHSLRLGEHFWRKGQRLNNADREAFAAAGLSEVIVARLDAGDVSEDAAALALAETLAGAHVRVGHANTGRCNLYATQDGMLTLAIDQITALNAFDESMTCATLPPFSRVRSGQILATIKVIPFAVPEQKLAAALQHCGQAALTVAAFKPLQFRLIQTLVADLKPSLLQKTATIMVARVQALGGQLIDAPPVAHAPTALAAALKVPHDGPTLIMGASAITDRNDVLPSAILAAGGEVHRVGLPVDPGNLLCLGALGGQTIIGLPGCARSPKLNGLDWVLERLCAGLPLDNSLCAAMGVGGLLAEVNDRPVPRLRTDPDAHALPPHLGAIVLAAGQSLRMGQDKLLLDDGHSPVIAQTVTCLMAANLASPLIVVGDNGPAIAAATSHWALPLVYNPQAASGMASSIRAGLRLVPDRWDGVFIILGDMPGVQPATLQKLVAHFAPDAGHDIIIPTYQGQRGNPLLWGRRHFERLAGLSGDRGAKALLDELTEAIIEVTVEDPGILLDIDTPEAWAKWQQRRSASLP